MESTNGPSRGMLWAIALGYGVLLVALPLALFARLGLDAGWLALALCAVPGIGAIIAYLFVQRLLVRFYYQAFWYWQVFWALLYGMAGLGALIVVLFAPDLVPDQVQTSAAQVPDGLLAGAAIGAAVTLAVVGLGLLVRRGRRPTSAAPSPGPVAPEAPEGRSLSYLEEWKGRGK